MSGRGERQKAACSLVWSWEGRYSITFAIENAGDPTADEIINYLEEQRLLADYYHRRQERPDYYQNRRARE